MPKRVIRDSDVRDQEELRKRLQELYDNLFDLMGGVQAVAKLAQGQGSGSGLSENERALLQSLAIGSVENPVASQTPVVPTYDNDPPIATSINGQLYRRSSDGVIRIFSESNSTWSDIGAAGSAHNILSATHGDTTASTLVRGDVLIVDSSSKLVRLPKGTQYQVLRINALNQDVHWGSVDDSQLSSNVALENVANVFTQVQQFNSGAKISSSGSTVTWWAKYTVNLAPGSVAANTSAEQIFAGAITGAQAGDIAIVNKSSLNAGISIGNVRVSGADNLGITYVNSTAAPIVPTTENYLVFVIRA